MRIRWSLRWLSVALMVFATPLVAVEPDEILDDPALEARARAISENVRCVVCQNEPIDSSNAGVARDMRIMIRERLVAGDSDVEVYDFLVARYGEFVLFRPRFKPSTYALWIAPGVILLIGGIAVGMTLSRRRAGAVGPTGLSVAEEDRLKSIMDERDR